MPDGHVFGHIRMANRLTVVLVGWIPLVADQEGGRLLRGVAVIVSQNVRIGLQEESNIGVADSLADDLRTNTGFERAGRVGVPQIVEGDPREPRSGGESVESLPDRVGMRRAAVLESEHVVAWVIVGAVEVSFFVLHLAPSA